MSIYFDHAASSWPKAPTVAPEIARFLSEDAANPGRGGHAMARRSGDLMHRARRQLAEFFGIDDSRRLVFTSGTTEAVNKVIHGFLKPGQRALRSPMEHNAVLRPLAQAKHALGLELEVAPGDKHGHIELSELERLLEQKPTALLCVNHISNVNGAIQGLKDITALAHKHGCKVLVDAAQSAGVLDISVRDLEIDFLAFSGHKGLLGPTGIGGLYVAPGLDLPPSRQGGTGSLSESESMPEDWPDCHEAGTVNTVGIVGLMAALEWLAQTGLESIWKHEQACLARALEIVQRHPQARVVSPRLDGHDCGAVFGFSWEGLEVQELAAILDGSFGIASRAGLHCAPAAHRQLGTLEGGLLRLSFGHSSRFEELDQLAEALDAIALSL